MPPLAPNRLTINARNWTNSVGIKLFWNPSADTDILGYKIYRTTFQVLIPIHLLFGFYNSHFFFRHQTDKTIDELLLQNYRRR